MEVRTNLGDGTSVGGCVCAATAASCPATPLSPLRALLRLRVYLFCYSRVVRDAARCAYLPCFWQAWVLSTVQGTIESARSVTDGDFSAIPSTLVDCSSYILLVPWELVFPRTRHFSVSLSALLPLASPAAPSRYRPRPGHRRSPSFLALSPPIHRSLPLLPVKARKKPRPTVPHSL
ncbi:hypothetical protein FKP32DRAFT_809919 [Trametes sanguinea]|nr:hypothetical protein FKP32DRAFT_809919 [Trametes sanguinea]